MRLVASLLGEPHLTDTSRHGEKLLTTCVRNELQKTNNGCMEVSMLALLCELAL